MKSRFQRRLERIAIAFYSTWPMSPFSVEILMLPAIVRYIFTFSSLAAIKVYWGSDVQWFWNVSKLNNSHWALKSLIGHLFSCCYIKTTDNSFILSLGINSEQCWSWRTFKQSSKKMWFSFRERIVIQIVFLALFFATGGSLKQGKSVIGNTLETNTCWVFSETTVNCKAGKCL